MPLVSIPSLMTSWSQSGGSSLLNGLQAYYALENVNDSGPNGLTLTNNGTVTFPAGKVNNCANFVAASSQYLNHTDNAAYQMGTSTDFTMCSWIKTGTLGTTNYYVTMYGEAGAPGYWFLFDTGNNIIRGQVRDNLGNTQNSNTGITSAYFNGAWHFFVMTVARSGNITLYVDNSAQTGASMAAVTGSLNDTQSVGLRIARGGTFFDGQVDEGGIWNRILTGTEISTLWNSGAGITYPFS